MPNALMQDEGVKIFLLIYHGELEIPIISKFIVDLGNGESREILNHPNIVVSV